MGYGHPSQSLKVKLPEGVTMVRTDYKINLPEPSSSWDPTIDGRFGKDPTPTEKNEFRRELSDSIQGGSIANCDLSSTSVFDSGQGPSIQIFFAIAGKVTLKSGEEVTISQEGSMTVSSSGYAGFWAIPPYHNPDNFIISYNLFGGDSAIYENPVKPTGISPLTVAFAVDEETKKLGMVVSPDENFILDVINVALGVIFKGHEMVYSWALGEVAAVPEAAKIVMEIAGGLV